MSSGSSQNDPEADLNRVLTAYWIAFGPHGPRALPPPGEGKKVALYTTFGLIASFIAFAAIRAFAGPAPASMTKEWQEATNEYLKVRTPSPPAYRWLCMPDALC